MSSNTILIVDDDSAGRHTKASALRKAGYDTVEQVTAAGAIEYLEANPVPVAILDVKLPDMHGFELCRLIKERFPSVGVLQTSATFVSSEDRVAGLDFGADAYLVEPMEDAELVAVVRALMRVRQAEAAQLAFEARFAQFAQASPDVMWIYDVGRESFEFISASFRSLFGIEPADALQDRNEWLSLVDPAHRDRVVGMLKPSDEQLDIEYRVVLADGTERWIRDRAFPLPGLLPAAQRIGGLARDITESKRSERQRELLIGELNHRVKNTLAIVQSLATHTLHAASSPDEFEKAFTSRLHALAHAHDMLTHTLWRGMTLQQAVDAALSPFASMSGSRARIISKGPGVWLGPNTAVTLTLAFHELATNATKYGSLSNDAGKVSVTWAAEPKDDPKEVHLQWVESGGPPVVEPTRRGFGSVLMEKVLAYEADGEAQLHFLAAGVRFECRLPLSGKLKLM